MWVLSADERRKKGDMNHEQSHSILYIFLSCSSPFILVTTYFFIIPPQLSLLIPPHFFHVPLIWLRVRRVNRQVINGIKNSESWSTREYAWKLLLCVSKSSIIRKKEQLRFRAELNEEVSEKKMETRRNALFSSYWALFYYFIAHKQ